MDEDDRRTTRSLTPQNERAEKRSRSPTPDSSQRIAPSTPEEKSPEPAPCRPKIPWDAPVVWIRRSPIRETREERKVRLLQEEYARARQERAEDRERFLREIDVYHKAREERIKQLQRMCTPATQLE